MESAPDVSGPGNMSQERPSPMRSVLILALGSLTYQVAQTALLPAVPQLVKAYHTNSSAVVWTFTGFLLSAAVLTGVFGRLGDMFGKRRLLVIALMMVAAGNVLCALASSLPVVIIGRVLAGAAGGVIPLALGIIRDEFVKERVRFGIGLISATAGIGAGGGLVIGGLLVEHANFHWIFWTTGAVALVSGLAAWWLVPESPDRRPARVDVRGAVILAAGLVMPLFALTQAHAWGWTSARTLGLIAAGLLVLAAWVAIERVTVAPLASIPTLSCPPVLMTNFVTLLTGFGMFGVFLLVPQLVEAPKTSGYGFGASAGQAGLLIVPGALIMMAVGPLSGPLGARLGSRIPLALGGIVTAAGVVGLGVAHATELVVLALSAVALAGIGLTYGAMPNLIIEAVPQHATGEATGLNMVVRLIGTALGAQVCGSILAASVIAGGALPSNDGFRTAFLVSGAVAAIGGAMSLWIPRAGGRSGAQPSTAETLAASNPLAGPAYLDPV